MNILCQQSFNHFCDAIGISPKAVKACMAFGAVLPISTSVLRIAQYPYFTDRELESSKDLVSLILQNDRPPYPGARFLRFAAVLQYINQAAGCLHLWMQATAKNPEDVPRCSDLERILQTLGQRLDDGFLGLVSHWETKLGTSADLDALEQIIGNLLASSHTQARQSQQGVIDPATTITAHEQSALVVALITWCDGKAPSVRTDDGILNIGESQVTVISGKVAVNAA